jgi:hypothetical protein
VLRVGVDDALQLGLAFDVALDQVDAVGVVDGHVHDGDVAGDPLRLDRALSRGDAVALQLDDSAGGRHDRGARRGCAPTGRCCRNRERRGRLAPRRRPGALGELVLYVAPLAGALTRA